MSHVSIQDVSKSFGQNTVVSDFELSIGDGEFISLLGPSGCGKTTVLRMVAGFESPSSGSIAIDGQDVTDLRPRDRNIGMMFQSYALFPNLTVAGNVGFGLKVKGVPWAEAEKRVEEMLAMVGLTGFGERYPFQLSGGQQQRVALARAIAPRPRVLLLDEPLSALDAKIRVTLRSEIRAIQRKLGISTLFVTHDQEEAMTMSDRVVVMSGGRADQVGTPDEIYNRPATRFVASFIGALNLLPARISDPSAGSVETPAGLLVLGRTLDRPAGSEVSLAIRPEGMQLMQQDEDLAALALEGTLVTRDFMGSIIRLRAEVNGGTPIIVDCFNRDGRTLPQPGQPIRVKVLVDEVMLLD